MVQSSHPSGLSKDQSGSDSSNDQERIQHVVFVCTGNTCRSPMAEALGKRILIDSGRTHIIFDSCGVAATNGSSASHNAQIVMQEQDIDLSEHKSKLINEEIIDRADAIYTMTPSHGHALISRYPGCESKIHPINEAHPIDDPFGCSVEVYREVADQLEYSIRILLKEQLR